LIYTYAQSRTPFSGERVCLEI